MGFALTPIFAIFNPFSLFKKKKKTVILTPVPRQIAPFVHEYDILMETEDEFYRKRNQEPCLLVGRTDGPSYTVGKGYQFNSIQAVIDHIHDQDLKKKKTGESIKPVSGFRNLRA